MAMIKLLTKVLRKVRHNPLTHWVYQSESLVLLSCVRQDYRASAKVTQVQFNDEQQLDCFQAGESWHQAEKIRAEFKQRLARGEKAATLCEAGCLASFAWLNPGQESAFFPLVKQQVRFPENSGAIYHVYTHPAYRGRGYYKQVLNGIVSWSFAHTQLSQLVTAIESDNQIAIKANLQIGFKPFRRLFYRKLFGIEKKGAVEL